VNRSRLLVVAGACYHGLRMRSLHPTPSRAERTAGFASFAGWYFADGAKEAAPA